MQAVAHRRIGRGAAALAEDAELPRLPDDVVNGEKVMLIGQFADELKLLLQERGHRRRRAVRPSLLGAGEHQLAQIRARRGAGRHHFLRIFVTQLVQGEAAGLRHRDGLGKQFLGIKLRQAGQGAQMAFAVRLRLAAEFRHRLAGADGGDDILQGLAFGHMHVDIVAGDDGQAEPRGEHQHMGGLVHVERVEGHFQRQAQARQQRLEAAALADEFRDGLERWNPKRETRIDGTLQIIHPQRISTLRAAPPAEGDELAELAVGMAVGRQQHHMDALGKVELGADDELDAGLATPFAFRVAGFGGDMRPHHAGHGTFIGDGDGGVTELPSPFHQFLRVRGATQEREVRHGVQLRERTGRRLALKRSNHAGTSCVQRGRARRPHRPAHVRGTPSTVRRSRRRRRSNPWPPGCPTSQPRCAPGRSAA